MARVSLNLGPEDKDVHARDRDLQRPIETRVGAEATASEAFARRCTAFHRKACAFSETTISSSCCWPS